MELREKIVEMIIGKAAALQKVDPSTLNEQTDLARDLSMKSGNLVLIIGAIEDEYDCNIDFMAFRKKATIGAAAEYVAELIEG